jgi:hypothetical protein
MIMVDSKTEIVEENTQIEEQTTEIVKEIEGQTKTEKKARVRKAKLEKQLAEVEAKIKKFDNIKLEKEKKAKARAKAEARKIDTRIKIILGAWVLHKFQENNNEKLLAFFNKDLPKFLSEADQNFLLENQILHKIE